MMDEQKALELWKRWFEWDGDPWIDDDYGNTDCFFCRESQPNHADDCIFVQAKELAEKDS